MSKIILRIALVLVLTSACASDEPKPSAANAGTSGASSTGGSGGTSGIGATGGSRAPVAGGSDATPGACTPDLGPNDEFFVPCEDAGRVVANDASTPVIDATIPLPGLDASVLPEVDAGEPPTFDEGPCRDRTTTCDLGHAETTIGTATCTIAGNALHIERELCEVCDKPTAIIDYNVMITDCGVCAHVYSEGTHIPEHAIAAGSCEPRNDSIDLAWSASDPSCVDVYAYVGSGTLTALGSALQVPDQVRICRCDRTTDTCITCAAGACDATP